MFRAATLLGFLSLACVTPPSVPDRPIIPDQIFKQRVTQLPSGLRVLIHEDHNAPLVAVATVVGSGADDDPEGQEGLAHLVEHLSFRALDVRLKRAGADSNATTEAAATTFYQLAHRDRLDDLLAIEGDRLADPLAGNTDESVAVECAVVRNELLERGDDPRGLALLFGHAFPGGHPLARPPGAGAPLSRATLASARTFVTSHYRPDNMTVVIAGDVDASAVLARLQQWSPRLLTAPVAGPSRRPLPQASSPPPPPQRPALPPPPPSGPVRRVTGAIRSRTLVLLWPMPGEKLGGNPFLTAALNELMATFELDRAGLPMTSGFIGSPHGSLFAVEVGLTRAAQPHLVRDLLLDRITDRRAGPSAKRLTQRTKWVTGTKLLRRSTDLLAGTIAMAQYLAATGRSSFYRDSLAQLAAIDDLELGQFLVDAINRDRVVALVVEPDPQLAAEASSATFVPSEKPATRVGMAADAVSLAGLGQKEILATVTSPALAALPHFRLRNGVEVVLVPRGRSMPTAALTLQLPVGDYDLTPFGAASVAVAASEGTCGYEDVLYRAGGHIEIVARRLPHRIEAEVFAGNLPNALVGVANRIRCREITKESIDGGQRLLSSWAELRSDKESRQVLEVAEAFWAHLYPDKSHGVFDRQLSPLQKLGEAELTATVQAQFRPEGALAVVSTSLSAAELAPLMETYLGDWKEPTLAPTATRGQAGPPALGRSVRVFQKVEVEPGGRTQTLVRIGCRLPALTEATLPAHDLLRALVARGTASVRASWGATYGLDVETAHGPGGIAHLEVSGPMDSDRAVDAVDHVFKLLAQLASDGPDIKSFTLERWDLGRELNRRFASADGVAGALLFAADQRLKPAVWDEYPQNLANLARVSLRPLLEPCAGRESVTLIGDKAALERNMCARQILPQR